MTLKTAPAPATTKKPERKTAVTIAAAVADRTKATTKPADVVAVAARNRQIRKESIIL